MILKNSHGLIIGFLENGSIKSIEADPIRINLKQASLFSKSGTNIYLRKRKNPIEFIALLGPESNSHFRIEDEMIYLARAAGPDLIMCVCCVYQKPA